MTTYPYLLSLDSDPTYIVRDEVDRRALLVRLVVDAERDEALNPQNMKSYTWEHEESISTFSEAREMVRTGLVKSLPPMMQQETYSHAQSADKREEAATRARAWQAETNAICERIRQIAQMPLEEAIELTDEDGRYTIERIYASVAQDFYFSPEIEEHPFYADAETLATFSPGDVVSIAAYQGRWKSNPPAYYLIATKEDQLAFLWNNIILPRYEAGALRSMPVPNANTFSPYAQEVYQVVREGLIDRLPEGKKAEILGMYVHYQNLVEKEVRDNAAREELRGRIETLKKMPLQDALQYGAESDTGMPMMWKVHEDMMRVSPPADKHVHFTQANIP